jgi:hypothetical protein
LGGRPPGVNLRQSSKRYEEKRLYEITNRAITPSKGKLLNN